MTDEATPEANGPRIPMVDAPDPEIAALLRSGWLHNDEPLNLPRIFAHHPRLFKRFASFAGLFLMKSSLSARDREFLTLRSTFRAGTEYYFGHHVGTSEAAGIDARTRAALVDPEHEWDGSDAILVAVADELIDDGVLSDATWTALTGMYPDYARQLEAIFIPGFYRMVAGVANTIRVEREPGLPGWPAI